MNRLATSFGALGRHLVRSAYQAQSKAAGQRRRAALAGVGGTVALGLGGSCTLARCELEGHATARPSKSGVRLRHQHKNTESLQGFQEMTAEELKTALVASGGQGLLLDIDETLSFTNLAWFRRLEELFGNPSGEPIEVLMEKYKLSQDVPFWQTDEAAAWMQRQRDSPEAQDNLPLIPGAVDGVSQLLQATRVVGYCTVRPRSVNANTIKWLRENGFPELPVVAKPDDVPFAEGSQWKASVLHRLWPEVTGLVDDNAKIAKCVGKDYPGKIFLFSHTTCPPDFDYAIPCYTWPEVVAAAWVNLARSD